MKSGRVGDKCLESGKGPGCKCTCKYLQPKNFLHKVSNFFRLHSGQKAKAEATFRRNLRIVARLICYSCFSRLMRLRQTYMQKTHLLSACFEECLHSNSCQPSAMRRISFKLFAEGCEKAVSRCLKLAKGTGILLLKQA